MYIGWYCIDCRAKPFEVSRHLGIIDTFSKLVCRPFLFSIKCRKVEGMNGMAVVCSFVVPNDWIMAVNPH